LTIAKIGNDWVVMPTSTSTDDVTYMFSLNVTDGCNYLSMNTSFVLHVGCPAAASTDTYLFVDNAPSSTTMTPNSQTTSVVNVTF